MNNSTHCPNCSELKMYVDQQAQLISQLMTMTAATNKRLYNLEKILNVKASESIMIYNSNTQPFLKQK